MASSGQLGRLTMLAAILGLPACSGAGMTTAQIPTTPSTVGVSSMARSAAGEERGSNGASSLRPFAANGRYAGPAGQSLRPFAAGNCPAGIPMLPSGFCAH